MTDAFNRSMMNDPCEIGKQALNNNGSAFTWHSDRHEHDALIKILSSTVIATTEQTIHHSEEDRRINANMVNINGFGSDKQSNKKHTNLHVNGNSGNSGIYNNEMDGKVSLNEDKALKTDIDSKRVEYEADYAETMHTNGAKPSSIVEICIGADKQPKTNDCGKWQVEIVNDDDDDNDGLEGYDYDDCEDGRRLGFAINSTEIEIVGNGDSVDTCEYVDQSDVDTKWSTALCSASLATRQADESVRTINSTGDRNLVFEDNSRGFESIENGQLEKGSFVIQQFLRDNDEQHDSKSDLHNKMSDHSRTMMDAKKGISSDKKKLINPGQGIRLRVNVKSQAEREGKAAKMVPQANTAAPDFSVARPTIISSAKSVSVKSVVKRNENIHTEYNGIDNNGIEKHRSELVSQPNSYLDDDLNKVFEKVVNYQALDIPESCVVKQTVGQSGFDLKKPVAHSEDTLLKMENARLTKLLIEVENARTSTVNTLLQVNLVLHKVQSDNTRLEGSLKSLSIEKQFLQKDLDELRTRSEKIDKENKDFMADMKATEFESSMQVILSSWKREKRELLSALSKSSDSLKNAETDAQSFRVQFTKVKEQLENSNATFRKLLERNVEVSKQMEMEIKQLRQEKEDLIKRAEKSSVADDTVASLQDELSRLKEQLERMTEEKDDLARKVSNLEKTNKKYTQQCDELQDELDHSQDIMDKLIETEDSLKQRLKEEISEKTYLQDCLDETGQILLHLRGTEEKLRTEKDELEEDLEEEIQVNESLQQSLKSTIQEHQALISRLQDMTHVHITVKESLQQASEKEHNYQQQIKSLQKTNDILHFMLEKEKEERMDVQEILDNSDWQVKQFKREKIGEVRDLEVRLEATAENEAAVKLKVENLEKENEDLRTNLEQEEEDNDDLRKTNARLQKYKDNAERDLDHLGKQCSENESEIADMKKRIDDLTRALKSERDKYENLVCTLEDTEESLEKVTKEANLVRNQVTAKEKEIEEMRMQLKEKSRKIHEMEIKIEEEISEKERVENRYKSVEKEVKDLRKKIIEHEEEIKVSQLHVKRLERENFCTKRNLDDKLKEFDEHRNRSQECLQRTKEELVGVQNMLVEKDMLALKQKENFQDALENTAADLKLLRNFLGDRVSDNESSLLQDVLRREAGKNDLEFLRNANHKAQKEMLEDVSHLEGMLKISKEEKQTVSVIRSPLSKIKLSEIKVLRDEMYGLNVEVAKVREKLSNAFEELKKFTTSDIRTDSRLLSNDSVANIQQELKLLDETLRNIENNHKYIIERNNGLINKGIVCVSRENSLDELDSTGESSPDDEHKQSSRQGIINAALVAENRQLKQNIDLLQSRLDVEDKGGIARGGKAIQASPINVSDTAPERGKVSSENPRSSPASFRRPPPSSRKYVPPTSMRYPPKSASDKSSNDYQAGYASTDSNDGGEGKNSKYKMSATLQASKKKSPSFFSAEMSMFHYDSGLGSELLRKKMERKSTEKINETNATSAGNAASLIRSSSAASRSHRRGSLDDDDEENDEDSDASIKGFRRSRTLPRKFKSKSIVSYKM
eukprot:gene14345-15841_t